MADLAHTSVSAGLIPAVAMTVAALGGDGRRLLAQAGLDDGALFRPHARITHACATDLLERAAAATGERAIGLRVAERLRPGALGLLDHLVRQSATVAGALDRARRYQRLLQDADLELDVRPALVAQVYRLRTGAPLPPALAECTLAGAAVWLRQMVGPRVRPHEVCFAHAPAGDPDVYSRVLGAPVRFRCAENAIVVSKDVLDMPLAGADPARLAVLERRAVARLAALPPEGMLDRRLRALVAARLARGEDLRQTSVARALHLSVRTLRRHLAVEGITYAALLEEVRRAHVDHDLATTALPLDEIAARAGFGDASALGKACRRWHGEAPGARRHRLTCDASSTPGGRCASTRTARR